MNPRIAYVCADGGIPIFGSKGASVHVQEVVRAFQRAGANVEIFAARLDGSNVDALANLRCHALAAPAGSNPAERESKALAVDGLLFSRLVEEGPFDLVYERHSLWSTAAMRYARDAGVTGLLEVNAPLIEEQAAHRVLIDRGAAERCALEAFDAADAIMPVSRQVADYVRRFVHDDKVFVVPNGVDCRRCSPSVPPSLPAASGTLTVGFVGTLKPWHGIDVLVDAFERLQKSTPDARLLVVGDGPERAVLERAQERLQSIVLTGAVSPADVPALLTSMDVACAPYPVHENFYFSPLKILEYMAAGRPIVASGAGQILELIEHDRTGVLCTPGDAHVLADAVSRLFADPAKRLALGAAARRDACQFRTWDAVATRILGIAAHVQAAAPMGAARST